MKKIIKTTSFIAVILVFLASCSQQEKPMVTITFDEEKTVPGEKVAFSEFDKNFPTDWGGFNYLVLDMMCSTSQRVYVGLTTETGYNELRIIFYGIGGRIRTAIPLEYFSEPAAGAHDLAATYNHKRPMSYINLDRGTRRPLVGVDSIGFRMHCPVGGDQKIILNDIYLAVEDPGDAYLEDTPVVDKFGQWNLSDFEDKAHSVEELKEDWAKEDAEIEAMKAAAPKFSKYGGSLKYTTDATGFFRVEKIDEKWWFVDPDGHLFLSLGANGIGPNTSSNNSPPKGAYYLDAPEGFEAAELGTQRRSSSRNESTAENPTETDDPVMPGYWNLFRRYGAENMMEKAMEKVADRMTLWGMNTVGGWGGTGDHPKPYMTYIRAGNTTNIFGLIDIYTPGFKEMVSEAIKNSVQSTVNDDMLIGYFIGNEPAFCNQEDRLAELILEADDDVPMKQAYLEFIEENGESTASNKAFAYKTFREYVKTICEASKKYDPNHLILGIRFGRGVPTEEVLLISKDYFDVYSFNNYGMNPMIESNVNYGTTTTTADPEGSEKNMFDEVYKITGLPMIIGEFHFGTTDRALGESLVRVKSQEERGIAFRNYSEAAFSHPALIGLSWFQWNDQEMFGRRDGENYNIGLVDITDRPYPHMVKAIQTVSDNSYEIHRGEKKPFFEQLYCYGGEFPDIWE
ncbi:MAG TPA: hypothetical protein VEP89_07455 [Draconibacterium sp.]|nr:hypothetical protein [Draconibacterium sp.]